MISVEIKISTCLIVCTIATPNEAAAAAHNPKVTTNEPNSELFYHKIFYDRLIFFFFCC